MRDPSKYYVSYAFFAFSNGLYSIFVNVLFFSHDSFAQLIYYQLASQTSQLIFFIGSTYFIRYVSAKTLFSIGSILRAIFILGLLIFPVFSNNGLLFGFIIGIASGIFWGGNATFSNQISRQTSRFSFLSKNSSISGLSSLIAPTVGGFIIAYSTAGGILRYYNDFILTFICLVLSSTVAIFIHTKGEKGGRLRISDTIVHEERYNKFRLYFFSSSVLAMILSTVIPVYIFYITKNYVITGAFGTVSSSIAFAANLMAPKISRRLKRFSDVAIIVIILASLLYYVNFFEQTFFVFLASSLIFFFLSPVTNLGMSQFMVYLDSFGTSRHFWINREYYLTLGRAISLGAVLWVSEAYNISYAALLMPVFSLSMLGYIPLLSDGKRSNEKDDSVH